MRGGRVELKGDKKRVIMRGLESRDLAMARAQRCVRSTMCYRKAMHGSSQCAVLYTISTSLQLATVSH
jgi:hypothetical protein